MTKFYLYEAEQMFGDAEKTGQRSYDSINDAKRDAMSIGASVFYIYNDKNQLQSRGYRMPENLRQWHIEWVDYTTQWWSTLGIAVLLLSLLVGVLALWSLIPH